MNRVTNITWKAASGTILGGFDYEYDAAGRIVSRSHSLGTNQFDRAYAYDGMDRLAADGDVDYAYDAAGNRTTRTEDGETVTYTLGQGDRLAAWTGGSYEHDTAGCVTKIVRGVDTWDLSWNGQYQLVSVSTNGVFAESYQYDALGRRVTTTNAEGTERHVYDDNWQVIADLDSNGNVLRSYVWGEGIDRLVSVKIGTRVYTALTDVQGTVWGYADEASTVVTRWTYDAWGNILSEEIAPSAEALRTARYRFQSRERSAATGLVNFRMRWYDPVTGRWLSKDPIRLGGGINLYVSFENNALNWQDPFGTFSFLPSVLMPVVLPVVVIVNAPTLITAAMMAVVTVAAVELALNLAKKPVETSFYFPKGGHRKNVRPSSREKHQKGDARRMRDQERSRRLNRSRSFPVPIDFEESESCE